MYINRTKDWWDKYFLGMAQYVSIASKDPSTQVGAVVVDKNKRIVSTGFNGFPKGIKDTEERLNNREIKYKLVRHAEENAITFAKQDLTGYNIYIFPFCACSRCAGLIIQSGITAVYYPYITEDKAVRWREDISLAKQLLIEAGVDVYEIKT